jgi:hypothetical protein
MEEIRSWLSRETMEDPPKKPNIFRLMKMFHDSPR